MSFHVDKNKQAQELSSQSNNLSPTIFICSSLQKHLGILLNEKLGFTNHINEKIQKKDI